MHVKHTDACVYMCLCMSVDVDIHVCLCVKDAYVWPVAMAPYKHHPGSTPGPLSHLHRNTYLYKYPQLILVLLAPAPPSYIYAV